MLTSASAVVIYGGNSITFTLLIAAFWRKVMKIEEIERRVENLHRHVAEHPTDCEAIIAEMQYKSMLVDKTRQLEANDRLKEVARIRKRRKDAEQRQRDRESRGHAEVDSATRSSGDTLPDTI